MPNNDYILRSDALEAMMTCKSLTPVARLEAVNHIMPIPSADVEPKRKSGRWIIAGAFDDFYQCPECGEMWPIFSAIEWKCCPICECKIITNRPKGEKEEIKMKFRKKPVVIEAFQTDVPLDIETLEGVMHANPGDWIITGINGEKYPCKPDIFEKTYDPVDDAFESDVEPVVHCKDCIHAEPLEEHEPDVRCHWWDYPVPPKGFCCKGTRKKEKKNETS